MFKLLQGHDSEQTAYLIEDYPYGRLRCKRKVWVERKKDKERPVSQTENPKNGRWNKPHCGVYVDRIYLYLDSRTNHVNFFHIHINGFTDYVKLIVCGLYNQLNDEGKEDLKRLIQIDKRFNYNSWRKYEKYLEMMRKGENPSDDPNDFLYDSERKLIEAQVKFEQIGELLLPE